MSDIAIMLNVIHFLELAEARSQLLDTKKGMVLLVFRLLLCRVMLQHFIGSHL